MAKNSVVIIANHHAGAIVLPRIYKPNPTGDPALAQKVFEFVTIPSGGTVRMDSAEFDVRKQSEAVQYYFDHGHLAVIKKDANDVDVTTGETTELEIPEHLQVDGEGAVTATSATGDGSVKAAIKSAKKGTATIA